MIEVRITSYQRVYNRLENRYTLEPATLRVKLSGREAALMDKIERVLDRLIEEMDHDGQKHTG